MIIYLIKHGINIILWILSILDRNTINSCEKLIASFDTSGLFVKTDTGWSPVTQIHRTKSFQIYNIKTDKGFELQGADEHICFDENLNEKYIKCFKIGDLIMTEIGPQSITSIDILSYNVCMCDLTVADNNHRYFTNGILSHNTTVSGIFLLHYLIFNIDKNSLILGNIRSTAIEILKKVKDIYDPLPWFLKPGVMKWNESEIVMDNGCRIIIGATTLNAGVSYTIHCALLDEFAKIAPNIQESFYTHVLPTITAGRARIMITSTQNGTELFCKLYTAAEAGENSYAPFKTDWWEVPEWDEQNKQWVKRDEKWKEMQIGNYGSVEAFEMQFGTSFTANSNTLVSNKYLSKSRQEWVKFVQTDELEGLPCNQYFTWLPEYLEEEDGIGFREKLKRDWFTITVDIAEGKGGDYTVFNFNRMKASPKEGEVLFECIGHFRCNEKDIKECARALYEFCIMCLDQNHYMISEEYNTYGALFVSYIQRWVDDEDPQNFSMSSFAKFYNENMTKSTIGLRVTHKDKLKYCTLFKGEIERGHIKNRSMLFNNELSAFTDLKGNGVYKASFGHDDLVMAQIQLVATTETVQFKYLSDNFLTFNAFDNKNNDTSGGTMYDFNQMQPSDTLYLFSSYGGQTMYDF